MTPQILRTQAHSISDVGQKRERNEDNLLANASLGLFVVADGMGGHVGGATASKTAVETIAEVIQKNSNILEKPHFEPGTIDQSPVAKLLSDALRGACHAVFEQSKADPTLHGMGTTATALVVYGNHAFVAHVGDSRAYLIRNNQILQLSEDHSLVNEQLKAGLISAEQARQSRFRNIITRSIGFESDVDVDMIAIRVMPNDVFLLCTDGLTNLVADQEIRDVICENYLDEAPQILVDLANHRGGDDNITAVLVFVADEKMLAAKKRIHLNPGGDHRTRTSVE